MHPPANGDAQAAPADAQPLYLSPGFKPDAGVLGAVLDTNVVLDWMLFADPRSGPLAHAIESAQLRWLTCGRMRDEFSRTLRYETLAKWRPDCERLLAHFDRHADVRAAPVTLPTLRCSDQDDQVFLDLAVAANARWLFTHDRALLRLTRRAARLGVHIVRPADWRGLTA